MCSGFCGLVTNFLWYNFVLLKGKCLHLWTTQRPTRFTTSNLGYKILNLKMLNSLAKKWPKVKQRSFKIAHKLYKASYF